MNGFDERLAYQYLAGQCTPDEARLVLDWFATEEGERFLVARIAADSQLIDEKHFFLPSDLDSERILNRILLLREKQPVGPEINVPAVEVQERNLEVSAKPSVPNRRTSMYRIAAAFAGIALLLAAAYSFIFQKERIAVRTAYGEVRNLTLPDHSTVTLNGNSTLAYDSGWRDGEPREVWLEGEAFFSVVHTESDQLFRVNGEEQFQVEVLGTEFNVSTRKSQPRVVLAEGKVRLQLSGHPADTVNLKPGEAVEKNKQGEFVKRQVDPKFYSSWKTRKLIFEETSLGEIVLLLKETYGLSVQVGDPALLEEKLTGSVPNENVDVLLSGIAQLFELRVTREKDKVRFERNI